MEYRNGDSQARLTPVQQPMKILFVTAEFSPYAKVGGLADVAGSLPFALQALGHEVVIALPAYGCLPKTNNLIDPFFVRVNQSRFVTGKLHQFDHHGLTVWTIDSNDTSFTRAKQSSEIYSFHRDDYLYFSQAVIEACQETNWIPDVIHCHDWHTGFIPAILRTQRTGDWDSTASVFTIHNLAYQGEFSFDTLDAVGMPHHYYHPEFCEAYGSVNFLKTGAVFADQINTVSPNYAFEIQTPEYGCRLDGHMRYLHAHGRLRGILNGIDTKEWNPATDSVISANYSAEDLSGKANCRESLVKECGFEPSNGPIIGMVTRLSSQKGFDLVVTAIDSIIQSGACLVVQGLGDQWAANELRRLEKLHPGRIRFFEKFDAELAQRIYAGCDAFLMPSAFEPCGLGQMFAMRYGTVPIVRHTGGLADTVFEDYNGFVLTEKSPEDLSDAIKRASKVFQDQTAWRALVLAGMTTDFSWAKSAKEYEQLYQAAVANRTNSINL